MVWKRRIPASVIVWLVRDFRPQGDSCRCLLPPSGDAVAALDAGLEEALAADGFALRSDAPFQQWRRNLLGLIGLEKEIAPKASRSTSAEHWTLGCLGGLHPGDISIARIQVMPTFAKYLRMPMPQRRFPIGP
jgi:hypothetical protein